VLFRSLEEIPHPTPDEIKEGLSGILCRCSGYYKIVQAIEAACQNGGGEK
jgi:aerobic-type carbon monoxide dehydrogenase small subunit (CoxS/CutS family)